MEVRLLGAVEVRSGSVTTPIPGPKLRGLLATLALGAGTTVSPQRLIDTLWGEDETPSTSTLQVVVSKLRRVLADAGEPDRLVSRSPGYELRIERSDVDALRFEGLVDVARQARPDWPRVAHLLEQASSSWSGEPLVGVPETDVLLAERARLAELHRVAVEDLIEARLGLGRHDRVVPELEALVADEPLRERRWALLMRALFAAERQADALRAYQRARDVLVEQIGVEPGVELRRMHEAVLAQDQSVLGLPASAAGPPIGTTPRRRGNLRHAVEPCIGRTRELEMVSALLDAHRLVTLVGPGGVGKTRLALEVTSSRQTSVVDGIWWVDLAPARTATDALAAVQRALGLEGAGVDPAAALDTLCDVLAERAALLVLDNCEHLLGEVVHAVGELLGRCGTLRVLATSREAFRLPGEAVFPLEPLAAEAAAELFQARVAVPIEGDEATSAVIDAICAQLDRLPLALELAAARTRHLRLEEMLERLVDRFDVLGEGSRAAPTHQRNLHAVAEWSYGLLEDPEQVVFERLSVFGDGATLEAARDVCPGHGVSPADVEGHLHRLVDKSLVVADRSGPVTRFRMLQTLKDYAGERLDLRGDRDATHRAHARWVCELARTVGWRARTTGATIAAVHAEDAAIRDAIAWSVGADPDLALQICDDLAPFWFGAMRVSTGWELLSTALHAGGGADPARRSALLAWALVFATLAQELDQADLLADQAWRFEVERADHERLGRLCFTRALAAGYRPDGEVDRWVQAAHEQFAAAELTSVLGHVQFAEGAGRLVAGDLEGAAERLSEAIVTYRREQDHLGLVLAVSRLGELAWRLDDLDLYAEMHIELLELGTSGRTPGVAAGATARLALAHLRRGELERAEELARAALDSACDTFMPVVNGYVFRSAGLVDLRAGHLAAGRAQLEMAIDAFEHGAGTVGVGQAALCHIDLSQSYLVEGEAGPAREAADAAARLAAAAADPWIEQQAAAQLASVPLGDA